MLFFIIFINCAKVCFQKKVGLKIEKKLNFYPVLKGHGGITNLLNNKILFFGIDYFLKSCIPQIINFQNLLMLLIGIGVSIKRNE